MSNPFADLKELEQEILVKRRVDKAKIEQLRTLVEKCRRSNPDAEECICYHGALALIHEADGSLTKAIRHREEEIAKIHRLYELELINPTGGYALQNYRKKDLKDREQRLKALYACKKA